MLATRMVRALIAVGVALVLVVPAPSAGADRLLVEMRHNLDRIGCGHNAPFALLYLRTTEAMREATRNGKFSDGPFWNRVTNGFGRYYLAAIEAWRHGHP